MKMKQFTSVEYSILKMLCEGMTNAQIGKSLFLSVSMVKIHIKNIFKKLDVQNRVQATTKSIIEKIV